MTYSAENKFPKTSSFYEEWTDIFANLLSFSEPASKEGLPNFACGMLGIILFGVFILAPKIRIREKISAVLVLAFITVSCNLNILNYIWHGFHFTNMIPYRFAFIFSFVLLTASFRAYDIILKHGLKIYQIIFMPIFPLVIFWLNYRKDTDTIKSAMPDNFKYSLIVTACMLFIFIIVKVASVNMKKIWAYMMSILLLATVCFESYSNAKLGVKKVSTTTYSSYPTSYDSVQSLLSSVAETETDLFYRVETTSTYTLNDSALYGYNGISQFSSSANVSVTKFLKKLGLYGSESGNRFMYRTSGVATNALLGIKYVISKNLEQHNDETYLQYYGSASKSTLYKNTHSLPLGYMMNSDVLTIGMEISDHTIPFEYQNSIFKLATGINEPLYTPQPVALSDYSGIYLDKTSYGNYTYNDVIDDDGNKIINFDYTVPENSMLFGYVTNAFEKVTVKQGAYMIDSNVETSKYPIVFPMGSVADGGTVSLMITINEEKTNGSGKIMVYAMDKTVFESMYEKLADEPFVITEFSDTNIKGTINALNDGLMYLSIPYEKGWSVYVDGQKQELVEVFDAMSGVELSAGEHEIELRYTPEGFVAGSVCTVCAVLLFVIIAVFDVRKRRKSAVAETSEPVVETEAVMPEIPVIEKDSDKSDDTLDIVNQVIAEKSQTQSEVAQIDEKKEDIAENEES